MAAVAGRAAVAAVPGRATTLRRARRRLGRARCRALLRPLRLARRLLARPRPLLGLAGADRRDALGDRDLQPLPRLRGVVEARQRQLRHALPHRPLDGEPVRLLLGSHEREGVADLAGPGGAPDAVDVVLGDVGHVEVDDVGERLDVDAARRDVGRDQHPQAAVLEPRQGVGALRLAAVAVDAVAGHLVAVEELGQAVGAVLGAGEDQHVLDLVAPQQLEQQPGLELFPHRVDRLGDGRGRQRPALDVDRRRVPQHLLRQLDDRRRQGGREQHGLAVARQRREHPPHVGQEAHVEHAVGLVEHQHLEIVEPRVVVLEMVEQASRGRHQDVDTAAEGALLRPGGDAAEDGRPGLRDMGGERRQVLGDLRRQLAGGSQHQGSRGAGRPAAQPLQDGQQEGRRLAAAGHRAGEHVAPGEGRRDRLDLDRSGLDEAEVLDAAQQLGGEAKGSKVIHAHALSSAAAP